MPRPQRDKEFPIFSSSGPAVKKKTVQQAASRVPSEVSEAGANTSELTPSRVTMEQILAEIKSVASQVNDMDDSVGARLDIIDGALSEIKVSVAAVESSLSALSNRVTDLEKRLEEVEERVSATEDSHSAYGTRLLSEKGYGGKQKEPRKRNDQAGTNTQTITYISKLKGISGC
ncbi:hypothetical protein SRHO_G00081140 [Serrasalmus rhombeus]